MKSTCSVLEPRAGRQMNLSTKMHPEGQISDPQTKVKAMTALNLLELDHFDVGF